MSARIQTLRIVTAWVFFSMFAPAAWALPVQSQLIKPRAFFMESENGLFEALDLKSKTLLTKSAVETCGQRMVREALTLNYSCTLDIPSRSRVSKLQSVLSPTRFSILFGGLKKNVLISVSPDAKQLTYSVAFDKTGLDFDVLKFNDDFAASNAKLAHLILAEAMKQPVRIEVLEIR